MEPLPRTPSLQSPRKSQSRSRAFPSQISGFEEPWKSEYKSVVRTGRSRRRKHPASPSVSEPPSRSFSKQTLIDKFVTASACVRRDKIDLKRPRDMVQQSIVDAYRRLKTPSSVAASVTSSHRSSRRRSTESRLSLRISTESKSKS